MAARGRLSLGHGVMAGGRGRFSAEGQGRIANHPNTHTIAATSRYRSPVAPLHARPSAPLAKSGSRSVSKSLDPSGVQYYHPSVRATTVRVMTVRGLFSFFRLFLCEEIGDRIEAHTRPVSMTLRRCSARPHP